MKIARICLLALSLIFAWLPGLRAEVRIENIKFRAAENGPIRTDSAFSLGEWIHMSLDIAGLSLDGAGMQDVDLYITAIHESGQTLMPRKRMLAIQQKPLYTQNRVAAALRLLPGSDWPEGKYVVTLEAGDRAADKTGRAKVEFVQTGLKPALINLALAADKDGEVHLPWVVQKGMKAFILTTISGLTYGEQSEADFTLDVLVRKEGKELVGQSRVLTYSGRLKEKSELIPAHVSLPFNLSGDLSYELVLTDRLADRKMKAVMPIRVID